MNTSTKRRGGIALAAVALTLSAIGGCSALNAHTTSPTPTVADRPTASATAPTESAAPEPEGVHGEPDIFWASEPYEWKKGVDSFMNVWGNDTVPMEGGVITTPFKQRDLRHDVNLTWDVSAVAEGDGIVRIVGWGRLDSNGDQHLRYPAEAKDVPLETGLMLTQTGKTGTDVITYRACPTGTNPHPCIESTLTVTAGPEWAS